MNENQRQYMVSCQLMGGLGNQLFQIFTTMAYGIRNKRKFIFPYSETLNTGISRNTYWDNFLSMLKPITTFNTKHGVTNNDFNRFQRLREFSFNYHFIPNLPDHLVLFTGYYQSYKYFENEKPTIFSMIRLNQQQEAIKNEIDLLNDEDHKISMHFRLGDYKNIQHMHPLMKYEYYERAIERILETRGDKKIKVLYFCEKIDNDEVNAHILKLKEKFPFLLFIKIDDELPDWKQMLVMSCCHDNIIANSTFSWWGAYFNQHSDKLVCFPSGWFGPAATHDVSDLFPIKWIKIDT